MMNIQYDSLVRSQPYLNVLVLEWSWRDDER